ncbi:hypothetical protein [Cohnella herbarum]|uniref:Beta-carotene 15,15'-monooxygenase n=1 Tax=Cohnella herbarum TaxID=2728023 RepID=A0A7Z2VN30_9BACL|nr:hypothetical protein [Cohnella herbarum]QJD86109.1 hypothetical protein HH215_24990 [Cohnella herbarum]
MTVPKLQKSTLWFLAIAMLIAIADMFSVRVLLLAEEEPLLVYAVLFDFMLVIPFLYWLLVLRRKGKSIAKIMAFPLLGALAAWLIVPSAQRSMVWNAIWPVEALIIAAEVAFIVYEIRIAYRVIKGFREAARHEPDTAEALRMAVHDGLGRGKLASVILHDASLIYYLLFSWKRKRQTVTGDAALFSYHKKTNQVLYSAIITKIILIEGVVVHLLVQQWSHWAAWILTIADLWLLALIWGDCRASALQPVKVVNGTLRLRYGLRIQADIPLDAIAEIASAREFHPDVQEQRNSALPILGIPNVKIALKQPVNVNGLLFLPRKVTTIYLALDEPDAFARELQ